MSIVQTFREAVDEPQTLHEIPPLVEECQEARRQVEAARGRRDKAAREVEKARSFLQEQQEVHAGANAVGATLPGKEKEIGEIEAAVEQREADLADAEGKLEDAKASLHEARTRLESALESAAESLEERLIDSLDDVLAASAELRALRQIVQRTDSVSAEVPSWGANAHRELRKKAADLHGDPTHRQGSHRLPGDDYDGVTEAVRKIGAKASA